MWIMNTNRVDFVFLGTLKAAPLVFVRSAQKQRSTIEPLIIHYTLHVPRLFIYSIFWEWFKSPIKSEALCVPFYTFCIVKIPKISARNVTKGSAFCESGELNDMLLNTARQSLHKALVNVLFFKPSYMLHCMHRIFPYSVLWWISRCQLTSPFPFTT